MSGEELKSFKIGDLRRGGGMAVRSAAPSSRSGTPRSEGPAIAYPAINDLLSSTNAQQKIDELDRTATALSAASRNYRGPERDQVTKAAEAYARGHSFLKGMAGNS
ncbi:MAG: hypothetical protein HYV63_31275 [Candidatus Schekmanbacteria bacterium]|nr:hypothetical protein [Candidatus Schekmanbacteria bacterium]